jgi:hypothetical protein
VVGPAVTALAQSLNRSLPLLKHDFSIRAIAARAALVSGSDHCRRAPRSAAWASGCTAARICMT